MVIIVTAINSHGCGMPWMWNSMDIHAFSRYFTSKGSLKSISKKVKDKDLLGGDLDDRLSM